MKLSTFELEAKAAKDHLKEIKRLRDWRRETAGALAVIDAQGIDADERALDTMYLSLRDADSDDFDDFRPDIHKSAWPALRAVLEQTLVCIEADLQRLGVEIDEPALFVAPSDSPPGSLPDGADGADHEEVAL